MSVSPFAPKKYPKLPTLEGIQLRSAATGMKYRGRDDLLMAVFPEDTSIAGVFTKSKTASAPVIWCQKALKEGKPRALLVNAGNANAFTGRAGIKACEITAKALAGHIEARPEHVFLASTGVIGEALEPKAITGILGKMITDLKDASWLEAAKAIMTTDTYPKLAGAKAKIGKADVHLNGFAKGSGMIAPDMATMLGFIFTDAPIASKVLQALLEDAVAHSFNAISVDGDTSTSDTVLAFATGGAKNIKPVTSVTDRRLKSFRLALNALCLDLAHKIVRDGEGAQKFVTIQVKGAENDQAARIIGKSIANSPLVKTAIAGEDANWGRIVMAIGKAGEKADRDKLSIWIGGVRVAHKGAADPAYKEAKIVRHMKSREIDIAVNVGIGKGSATVWTCDLTHDYISINTDYRS